MNSTPVSSTRQLFVIEVPAELDPVNERNVSAFRAVAQPAAAADSRDTQPGSDFVLAAGGDGIKVGYRYATEPGRFLVVERQPLGELGIVAAADTLEEALWELEDLSCDSCG